jgi:TP901 family phage tail tape measure protein
VAEEAVDASVVLTADTAQYDSAMQQSAAQTQELAKTVDSLASKLDRLSKSAGKKLIGLAAVDTAAIVASTAAFAAYEKQMESLSAQAAVLNRTTSEQTRVFKSYEGAVQGLRSTFAMSTREAAALTQQLSKMGDGTQTIDRLAMTFGKLASVSGEAPQQLAQSILTLQRTMGMPQRETERFANTLTNLAARTNTSVSGIAEFSQSIAPMARQVGMTANEVAGVSTAFIRAGQDGYQAANAFNKILGDISYATATGSPDLAKYANLIGVTVENFKEMDKTEAVTRIFETLNRQGPQAITTLNRLGLDGLRTQRAITALAQGGGLRGALREAQGGDPEALSRGSKEAMDGIIDSLSRTRVELTQTAEAMGSNFAGPARGFVAVVETMAKAMHSLADSPLGDLVADLMLVAGPLAGLAGGMMLAAKAVLAFAGANQLLRSSLLMGYRDARSGQTALNSPGAALARGEGGAGTRWMYNRGQSLGMLGGLRADPTQPGALRRGIDTIAGRGLQGAGFAARLLGYAYQPGAYNPMLQRDLSPMYNPALRETMFKSPTFMEAGRHGMANTMGMFSANQRMLWEQRNFNANPSALNAQRLADAQAKYISSANAMNGSMQQTTKGFGGVTQGLKSFGAGLAYLGRNMAGASMGALAQTGSFAGRAGKWAFNQLGGSWLTAGMLGYAAYEMLDDDTQYEKQDMSNSGAPYLAAGGLSNASPFSATAADRRALPRTATSVRQRMTGLDQFTAMGRELSNSALEGMTQNEATAYLQSQYAAYRNNPQSVDELKLDLIKLYGTSGAYNVFQQLESGFDYGGGQTFMHNAFDQPRRNWGISPASKEAVGKQLNLGLGVDQDRINATAAKYGNEAGWSEMSKGMQRFIGTFAANDPGVYSAPMNTMIEGAPAPLQAFFKQGQRIPDFLGGGGWNRMTGEEEAWHDALQQNFGLATFSEDDFKKIRVDLENADSSREAMVVALESFYKDESISAEERMGLLSRFGIKDPTLTGQDAVDAILDTQIDRSEYTLQSISDDPDSLGYRLAHIKGATISSGPMKGQALVESGQVQKALEEPENVNAQLRAVRYMQDQLTGGGMGYSGVTRVLGQMRVEAGSQDEPMYQLAAAAQAWNQQLAGWQQTNVGRPQAFGMQTRQFQANMRAARGDENQEVMQQQYMKDMFEQAQAQKEYFIGLLYQQREYNVMRERAEEDYNLSRKYAQEDFHRSRMWQEQDYEIARARAMRNFNIAQNRAQQNFNISRRRQEQDHQHQIVLMAENAAKQMSNIYERVAVQRTSSSEFILYNAQDQLERMREQSQNLEELRRRGMSNRTIDQLQLNDPANAQQLETIIADIRENPELVKRFNRMIMNRIRAARDLVTDESDTEWREFLRQYRLNRNRAVQDFRKVTHQAREDQRRAMNDMEKDYRRQLGRQQVQYEVTMGRQEDAYRKTMKRSAEDLSRAARTISGNFENILERSTRQLSGMAKRQAESVENHFKNLKQRVVPEAVDLMEILADVFKVEYKVPASAKKTGNATIDMITGAGAAQNPASNLNGLLGGGNGATGGVVPGWSPGVDNQNYVGPGGQKLSLSGGEAIMRPEFTRLMGGAQGIKALNQAAIHNKFFLGGIMPTQAVDITKHSKSDYPTKSWSGDLNDPGTGDLGDPVKAWKAGTVAKALDIGDQSYGRYIVINHPGGQNSLYAHLSRMRVQVGDKVSAGELIGNVGGYGKATGPHLHFEVGGGSVPMEYGGYSGGGGGYAVRLADIIKQYYMGPERAVSRMNAMRPLGPGDISKIINRGARKAWREMVDRYGRPTARGIIDGVPNMDFGSISTDGGNVATGKQMAKAYGWGSGDQWDALHELWVRESNWNHQANNPSSSAYGIPQGLVSLHNIKRPYWGEKVSDAGGGTWRGGDPKAQIAWGLNYIKNRYGGPRGALQYHNNHNSYADGSIFQNGAQTINVGERGPEAVIPLNERGAEFVAGVLERTRANYSDVRGTQTAHHSAPLAHNLYNTYKIDKSTNFTGPITVQANDTREFLRELRERQRTAALTQPQMAGAR